jgi:5-methyltetrahydrofolate--homocysteine methyltransferase
VIGFDRPFVDHRRAHQPRPAGSLAEEMAGNFDTVIADAIAQVGPVRRCSTSTPASRSPTSQDPEPDRRARAVDHRRAALDRLVDRGGAGGRSVYQGKPLVNSVTGEDEQMERVLPLVAKHGAA